VSFPLRDEPNVKLVAWTTTPWTLPSNLALCVNPTSVYVKILGRCRRSTSSTSSTGRFLRLDKSKNETFILMEKRLADLYKKPDMYQVLDTYVDRSANESPDNTFCVSLALPDRVCRDFITRRSFRISLT
jgi:isoleucyl-tRNA synthetase